MIPFQIRAPMLASLFGVADELGTLDETVLSTVNVRLDQIFHMALRHNRSLVVVHRCELEKLIGLAGIEVHELACPLPDFIPKDDGVPEDYVNRLNEAPEVLMGHAEGRAPWALVQTPMLRYKCAGRRIHSEVWTRVVYCTPVSPVTPQPARRRPMAKKAVTPKKKTNPKTTKKTAKKSKRK